MHGEEFHTWLAEKATEALDKGQVEIVAKLHASLHTANAVDALRKLVKKDDIPRLLRIAQTSSEPSVRILTVSILAGP